MFRYYWREKGDPTRWCFYDENRSLIEANYPELIKAWEDYMEAKARLDRLTK